MTQQRLEGKRVSPVKGILTIAALAVSIILISWAEQALDRAAPIGAFRFAVWIVVAAECVAIFRMSYQCFRYTLDGGHFFVERIYGDQGRVVHDIDRAAVLAIGPKDDIFKRYGNGQAYESATIRGCALPQKAIAYRKGDHSDTVSLLLIQPDQAMAEALDAWLAEDA